MNSSKWHFHQLAKKVYSRHERNFDDPAYKDFRAKVLSRDGHKCQMPMCKSGAKEVHHIKTWASEPSIRFSVSNGISLCKACHRKIWGKEDEYEQLFFTILAHQGKVKQKKGGGATKTNEEKDFNERYAEAKARAAKGAAKGAKRGMNNFYKRRNK